MDNAMVPWARMGLAIALRGQGRLDEALALFRPEEKVFVIGGAQIYAQALPLCDEFYLTRVFHAYQGDTCFPRWDEREWEIIDSESFASGKEFPYPFAFEHYRRRK